jgi:hypothetical protein
MTISFPAIVARAARAALQWRLLILWSALLLIPTAVLALPVWGLLGVALDHSVQAGTLAQRFDALSAFDLLAVVRRESYALNTAGLLSLVLTLALAPLLSGLTITAARATAPAGFRLLFTGALGQYGRMVRMLVWSAIPLGLALAVGGAIVKLVGRHNLSVLTEDEAGMASMAAMGVALVLFWLAHTTVDAGRAVLALEPQRTSAVKAWWRGLRLVNRRPLVTFGPCLVLLLAGLAVAAVLALLRIRVAPLGAGAIILGVVLTQLAALALAWSRQARLFALYALMKQQAPHKKSEEVPAMQ